MSRLFNYSQQPYLTLHYSIKHPRDRPHCDYKEKEGLLFHYTVTLIHGKRNKQIDENVVIQLHIVDAIIDAVFGIYEQCALRDVLHESYIEILVG